MIGEAEILELNLVGAIRLKNLLQNAELERLAALMDTLSGERPGERISDLTSLRWLLENGAPGRIAGQLLGARARPVRALLFDKSATNNWALGWHQDRTIAVRERRSVEGFDTWTVKKGVPHVEPPFEFIERMLTLRLHLDEVDGQNAPLSIARESHRKGKLTTGQIEAVVANCGKLDCLAQRGDVWVYRTSIVHSSKRSSGDRRRRVLQVDYSGDELPGGLDWLVGVSRRS